MSQFIELLYDELQTLLLMTAVLIVGLGALHMVGKVNSFEKRYTLEDLKYLKYSMIATPGGSVILSYKGTKDSDIKIIFDKGAIKAGDVVEAPNESIFSLVPVKLFSTALLEDNGVITEYQEISPAQDIVEGKRREKYTPYFYIGVDKNRFFAEPVIRNS